MPDKPIAYRIRTKDGQEFEVADPAAAKREHPDAEVLFGIALDPAGNAVVVDDGKTATEAAQAAFVPAAESPAEPPAEAPRGGKKA